EVRLAEDGGRVLVVAPHRHDEVLGWGGSGPLHAGAGHRITIVTACEGESLRYGPAGVGQGGHILRAAAKLGAQDVRQLRFPDQSLDTVRLTEIIAPLEEVVRQTRPRLVYCQYGGDGNRGPQNPFKAARAPP